jgi:hypothetical protein
MNLEHGSILFNRTIDQCRSTGRRGGRARAQNLRLRHVTQAPSIQRVIEPRVETIHEANLQLDAQFPWIAGCERLPPRRS